jgi:acyl dehydratase
MKYPEILSIAPAPGTFTYDADYTILYALGLGLGGEPDELPFVYERHLKAMPTMAVMMAHGSGDFIAQGGIDYTRIVHGEQRLTIHAALPATGAMSSTSRCLGVIDKGKEKGALVKIENTVRDATSGTLHATAIMTLFCRGDGGFGGPADGELPVHPIPERPHDLEVTIQTLPQQAAIYRLSGDRNPLHIDPDMATSVGFPRPILHGLSTYGVAARAIMRACCDNDPAQIERFDVRFSSPVFPGEAITTRIWQDRNQLSFECLITARGAAVIRNGLCQLRT